MWNNAIGINQVPISSPLLMAVLLAFTESVRFSFFFSPPSLGLQGFL